MQRLAVAIILVAALVAALGWGAARVRQRAGTGIDEGVSPMQRAAYFVLVALMLYVSVMGAAI